MSLSSFFASGTSSAAMHAGHAEIDFGEVVDGDQFGDERLGGQGGAGSSPRSAAAGLAGSLTPDSARPCFAVFDHGFHVLSFDALQHVLEFGDRRADERRLRIVPMLVIGSFSSSPVCSASCGSTGAR